jgi:methylmalonyl-CoA mutase
MRAANEPSSRFGHRQFPRPRLLRILTAVPICDGHDSAILTINQELVRHGVEVIYLGYHRAVRDIVRAAVQEDVDAIGISSYNGGHVEFFSQVAKELKRVGAEIRLFGGGGGTISEADAAEMKRRGTDQIFFAGTPLETIVEYVIGTPRAKRRRTGWAGRTDADMEVAARLHLADERRKRGRNSVQPGCPVIGISGPGGAGKTTLIDELALRFLRSRCGRLAILAHDPGFSGAGALLGDRAAMVYAHNDRVFMRSVSTGGASGGLAKVSPAYIEALRHSGFELVLVESTGIGQHDDPFSGRLVDKQIFVVSPDYGSRLQLQKLATLRAADLVVVNKSDLPPARTAFSEIEQQLAMQRMGQAVIPSIAKRHQDPGVDRVFEYVSTQLKEAGVEEQQVQHE